jgi:hypothetical protein
MHLHHVADADLQIYYLGGFAGIELDVLDEHLHWCPTCIKRLSAIESRDMDRHSFLPEAFRESAA